MSVEEDITAMTEEEYIRAKRRRIEARKRRKRQVLIQKTVLSLVIVGTISAMIFHNAKKKDNDIGKENVETLSGLTNVTTDGKQNGGFTKDEMDLEHPLIFQTDKRWSGHAYGSSTVGVSGCAPTCISMAALALNHDETATPAVVADYSAENDYYVEGSGTKWTLISEGIRHFGMTAEEVPLSKSKMEEKLDSGALLILALGPGDFTSEGHFIVVYGYTGDGFLVNDPNSIDNSSIPWSYDKLEGQIRNIWAVVSDK